MWFMSSVILGVQQDSYWIDGTNIDAADPSADGKKDNYVLSNIHISSLILFLKKQQQRRRKQQQQEQNLLKVPLRV